MNELLREMPLFLIFLASTLLLIGERRVHGYNYDFLRFAEGEELVTSSMSRYYSWVASMPLTILLTHVVLPKALQLEPWLLPGAIMVVFGVLLRLWAIRSLGRLWSRRCVFVAGMPRVDHGPYRILSHPEYVGRAIEGLGFILVCGVNPLSALAWCMTQLSLLKVSKAELRQLHELSVAPLQLQDVSSRVSSSKL